ncbi:MAG: hypothetical protein ACW986_06800 [Promethearchaeota archaeon]|jgi:hypothetical protein
MATNNNKSEELGAKKERGDNLPDNGNSDEKLVSKEIIPHFFPTYRVKRALYPIPIIIVVLVAGVLSYLTYVEAGIQIDGGYISESEYGAIGGLINGLIYTGLAALSAFIIIFIIKRKGVNMLMYIFGIGFGIVVFFQTWFFGEVMIFLIFSNNARLFYLFDAELILFTGILTVVMIYKYFTSKSIKIKNFIVLYVGLLIGASMGVLMPLWTTLAILIGISCWDLFAVLYKRGPIKQLIEIVSVPDENEDIDLTDKIKSGEYKYDTSKLEIGIGDLAFYSMLTSSALVQTNNVIILILSAIAIISGTGITIMGLKRNKILPGLPISIFLGIGTMLLSWFLFTL